MQFENLYRLKWFYVAFEVARGVARWIYWLSTLVHNYWTHRPSDHGFETRQGTFFTLEVDTQQWHQRSGSDRTINSVDLSLSVMGNRWVLFKPLATTTQPIVVMDQERVSLISRNIIMRRVNITSTDKSHPLDT